MKNSDLKKYENLTSKVHKCRKVRQRPASACLINTSRFDLWLHCRLHFLRLPRFVDARQRLVHFYRHCQLCRVSWASVLEVCQEGWYWMHNSLIPLSSVMFHFLGGNPVKPPKCGEELGIFVTRNYCMVFYRWLYWRYYQVYWLISRSQ